MAVEREGEDALCAGRRGYKSRREKGNGNVDRERGPSSWVRPGHTVTTADSACTGPQRREY